MEITMTIPIRKRTYSEPAKAWFRSFIGGAEMRSDLKAGQLSGGYTEGAQGGYFVPSEIFREVVYGIAQFDPLLDENVVTLIPSDTPSLKPISVPGWDLSEIAAELISEGAQRTPFTVPDLDHAMLNGYTFRTVLDATFELEEDAFEPLINQLQRAYSIAFARGIGQYLLVGSGSNEPTGVLTAAANSNVTISSAQIGYSDIENIYFSIDLAYRSSDKCAWLMSDKMYQQVRKATDSNGRPLISIVDDKESLMGRPVLISPSMPTPNPSVSRQLIVFGDFSHYIVRLSQLRLRRSIQAPGYVDAGKALYSGFMRCDANLLDPTGGSNPPIVFVSGV
jgi:HK97 family phage major capsid protein